MPGSATGPSRFGIWVPDTLLEISRRTGLNLYTDGGHRDRTNLGRLLIVNDGQTFRPRPGLALTFRVVNYSDGSRPAEYRIESSQGAGTSAS